ncbi:MAG: DUF4367 domain-containing protein [Peptococcaceae bacterium]|nr:DUF4367 domain-containing protein [Peptococcaceae bacterium]
MRFTEEQLRIAAKRADERLFAQLPDEAACMDYTFSETFEQNMAQLIEQVKADRIAPAKVSMGWRYYTRNGLVAVLLCFMLSCMAMPDIVLAGYQKLVEVIETVVTEYTEYRYHSSETADAEFVPVTFGWLPDGMEEVERELTERRMNIYFENESEYFDFSQKILTEENGMTYIIDTESADIETYYIGSETVQLVLKNGAYDYIWVHGKYLISGQTNLSSEEIVKILDLLK